MPSTIGLVAAGEMGAAVGGMLVNVGSHTVLTTLKSRSPSTNARAASNKLTGSPSLAHLVQSSSFVFSILPPSEALSFAKQVAEALSQITPSAGAGADGDLIFVDANAISPGTMREINTVFTTLNSEGFTARKVRTVDASIIGGPPREGYNPIFYISSDEKDAHPDSPARTVEALLKGSGIRAEILTGPGCGIGSAKALKMSYAGLTKGFAALAATMTLAASKNSVLDALLHELQSSQPGLLQKLSGSVPMLRTKAYRFVGEFEEMGQYLSESGVKEGAEAYIGMSKVFQRVDREKDGEEGTALWSAANTGKRLLEESKTKN